jgi:hypothetical protein
MGWRDIVGDYQRWQERWRDPILTALLVLLSLHVFVIMPLALQRLRGFEDRCNSLSTTNALRGKRVTAA